MAEELTSFKSEDNVESASVYMISVIESAECEGDNTLTTKTESQSTENQNDEITIKSETNSFEACNTTVQKYFCDQCDSTFEQFSEYKKHRFRKHKLRAYKCNQCHRYFLRKRDADLHKKIVHRNGKKKHLQLKAKHNLKCSHCDRTFKYMYGLKIHERSHTGEKPFICQTCGMGFVSSSYLNKHLRVHTGFRPHQCQDCGKCFTLSGQLSRHMVVHTGVKKYQCKFCEKRFNQRAGLKRHEAIHFDEKPWNCEDCDKSFRHKSELKVHVQRMHVKRQLSCSQCGKTFASKRDLNQHQKIHKNEENTQNIFQCEICKKNCRTGKDLEKHRQLHNNSSSVFKCDVCNKIFAHRSVLERHSKSHSSAKSFFCIICGKGFKMHYTLQAHMKLHDDNQKKPFQCNECDKFFSNRYGLNYHINAAHTPNDGGKITKKDPCEKSKTKSWKCKYCEDVFFEYRLLRKHVNAHPESKTKIVCHLCGHGFASESRLSKHIDNHDTESHKCMFCEKVYKWKKDLKQHEKTVHFSSRNINSARSSFSNGITERKIQGDVFQKEFTSIQSLNTHKTIQPGPNIDESKTVIECAECSEKFSNYQDLKTHVKSHDVSSEYICKDCGVKFNTKQSYIIHLQMHAIVHDNLNNVKTETGVSSSDSIQARLPNDNWQSLLFSSNSAKGQDMAVAQHLTDSRPFVNSVTFTSPSLTDKECINSQIGACVDPPNSSIFSQAGSATSPDSSKMQTTKYNDNHKKAKQSSSSARKKSEANPAPKSKIGPKHNQCAKRTSVKTTDQFITLKAIDNGIFDDSDDSDSSIENVCDDEDDDVDNYDEGDNDCEDDIDEDDSDSDDFVESASPTTSKPCVKGFYDSVIIMDTNNCNSNT